MQEILASPQFPVGVALALVVPGVGCVTCHALPHQAATAAANESSIWTLVKAMIMSLHASILGGEPMKTTNVMLAVLVVLLPAGGTAQTLYKCVQGGSTIYQAEPCPANAKQDTLKSQRGASASDAASGAELDRMIEFMSTYRACADGVKIWGQEMAAPYEEWRSRNSALVSRIESDRQLQARYQQRVDGKRNGKAGMCREVALELRGKTQ
jgi:hypothetical protein